MKTEKELFDKLTELAGIIPLRTLAKVVKKELDDYENAVNIGDKNEITSTGGRLMLSIKVLLDKIGNEDKPHDVAKTAEFLAREIDNFSPFKNEL